VHTMSCKYSSDVGDKKCIQNFDGESALIAVTCKTNGDNVRLILGKSGVKACLTAGLVLSGL
jgi:hypothetical protein